MKKTLRFNGLYLKLDSSRAVVSVTRAGIELTASYERACDTRVLYAGNEAYRLSRAQLSWLESKRGEVQSFLDCRLNKSHSRGR